MVKFKFWRHSVHKSSDGLLGALILLTVLWISWQLSVYLSAHQDLSLIDLILSHQIQIPWIILPGDLFYLGAQFFLYAIFVFLIYWITDSLARLFAALKSRRFLLGILLWILAVLWVTVANQYFYPESIFSMLLQDLFPPIIALLLVWSIGAIFVMFVGLTLFENVKRGFYFFNAQRVLARVLIGVAMLGGILFASIQHLQGHRSVLYSTQPNVIIIGIDSLRPDHVGAYGDKPSVTPHLDALLSPATNFMYSLTPLARTFQSWSSILTGEYPKHSDIRFDLIDQSHLQLKDTLSAILKRHGYTTIYGIDEERFSNISKQFGFDRLIGIQAGANDFLLGSVNDFPLSNLVVNTRLGETLFPYSFGNRAAADTYDPNSFLKLIDQQLSEVQHRPVFLAVHFCLPHWPYRFGALQEQAHLTSPEIYDLAIARADQQVNDLLKILRHKHLLDNALVIVISDHGNAFALPGDRLITEKNYLKGPKSRKDIVKVASALLSDQDPMDTSVGHGTDVLSDTQYRTVLAFRGFGNVRTKPAMIQTPVSLVDIEPTVLSALKIRAPKLDGFSLWKAIQGKPQTIPKNRMIFTETGFTPTAMKAEGMSVKNVVFESLDLFQISPKTGQITFKPSILSRLLLTKQRAVYYQHWVLAFYPDESNFSVPILVNRSTGKWTDDLTTPFAKHSPASRMLKAMRAFYGDEINYSTKH